MKHITPICITLSIIIKSLGSKAGLVFTSFLLNLNCNLKIFIPQRHSPTSSQRSQVTHHSRTRGSARTRQQWRATHSSWMRHKLSETHRESGGMSEWKLPTREKFNTDHLCEAESKRFYTVTYFYFVLFCFQTDDILRPLR